MDVCLLGGLREENKLCFLYKGLQKSTFGLSEKDMKNDSENDSILVPCWYLFCDFSVPENDVKNSTPNVSKMVPKGTPNRLLLGAKN